MMGFSMFFPENDVVHHSSPYASVDCTLSLGTPSTRLCNDDDDDNRRFASHNSNALGWDFLNGGKKNAGGGGGNNLLARRCANCDTTSTPLWRNGPRGPKSLCNACGIRYKKEERRATAGNSTSGGGSTVDHQGGVNYYYNNNNNNNNHYASPTPWIHHHQQHNTQRVPYYSPANTEYSFVDDIRDNDHDVTTDPFLSWKLNVADRTSLVHDFTM